MKRNLINLAWGVLHKLLAGLLVVSLVLPSVHVNAASSSVTFYLKGDFTTIVHASGGATDLNTGVFTPVSNPASNVGPKLLTGAKTEYIDNDNYKGSVTHGLYIGTTLNADGYYEATVSSSVVSDVVDYLEGHGSYGHYQHNPACKKFEVTEKDGAYYAEQVQGDHSYEVDSPANFEHGTVYKCKYCNSISVASDKLKATLTFNATTNGGTTTKTSQQYEGDSTVNLTSFIASKSGWEFVGWNTDSTAHEALAQIRMNNNKTVYAIFKKDLTVNFVDG